MSVRSKLKLIITCFILFLILGIVILVSAPYLVSNDAIRLRLAKDLSSMTGYNVQLREPPKISVFPSFQASLPHVILTDNAPNHEPLMDAEEIIVHMSLLDALIGKARFSQTKLIKPHFTMSEPFRASTLFKAFAKSEGSFGNAVRATQERLRNAGNDKKQNIGQVALFNQPFGRITIVDGQISYPAMHITKADIAQPQNQKSQKFKHTVSKNENHLENKKQSELDKIKNINAEIEWPANSSEARINATATWHGVMNSLNIEAENALLFISGGKSNIQASFNSINGGVTFNGTTQIGKSFQANGKLAARSPGVSTTLSWLGFRSPLGANITTPFIWNSDLKTYKNHTELKNIILKIGSDANGNSGRGALDVNLKNNLPYISGSLAFERLNIGLLSSSLFTTDTSFIPSPEYKIDMPIFDLFGLDLRISSSQVMFNQIPIKNAAASIQVQEKGLIFDVGTMNIFGGDAQSSIHLRSDKDRITGMNLRFSATQTDLQKLQQELDPTPSLQPKSLNLQGNANIGLNIEATFPEKIKTNTPIPTPKPELVDDKAGYKNRQEQKTRIEAIIPSYSALFFENIWPYAKGEFHFNMNEGSFSKFDMQSFEQLLISKQSFALSNVYKQHNEDKFLFDSLNLNFKFDRQNIEPIEASLNFDKHKLNIDGYAHIAENDLILNGILDPLKLNKYGQCENVQCLQKSLSPPILFKVYNNDATEEETDKKSDLAEKVRSVGTNITISPRVGILPY